MLLPARPLLFACAAWMALGAAVSVEPEWLPLWWQAGGALLAVALVDAAHIWWESEPAVRRKVQATLPLGVSSPVEVFFAWKGESRREVRIADFVPDRFEAQGLP